MEDYVTILPSSRVESSQYVATIRNLRDAMIHRTYNQITRYASEAIDILLQSQLTQLLDIRAHGYFMQRKSNLALQDASSIIQHEPTLITIYLRQANIYSLCGQQSQAIKAYNDGLINAVSINEEQLRRIFRGKMMAECMSEQKVDFFTKLPTEIVNDIIVLLPQTSHTQCMLVSDMWRQRIVHCQTIWNNLVLDDRQFGCRRYILCHCICWTICATMTNSPPWHTEMSIWMPIESGILNARNTLKHLDLELGDNMIKNTTKVAETLSFCENLTSIKISSPTIPLSTALPSLSSMKEQYNIRITNLQLNFSSITDEDMESILRQCRRLQRLVMNGCNDGVFDPLYHHGLNLEIIGYNCCNPKDIPDLEDDNEQYSTSWTTNVISTGQQQRDDSLSTSSHGKLRMFFADTQDPSSALPAFTIMPLLYKYKETLSVLHINIALKMEKKRLLHLTYPNFTLSKLMDLSTWLPHSVQQFFLDTIRHIITL
ncbi:hypothetical protein BDA99DRAFT_533241 [Phascolomyces articulosus]|uniref:F-box domain-containing protein n=1 Tax=Phascolomyces articulosus TaxID=60185 RepID=A0AAD5K8M1_9FUNG|nr:hypothetical protein BDA99DRAFT_533241 [Phascolomyces articulosus]